MGAWFLFEKFKFRKMNELSREGGRERRENDNET
jgi:hypothetical protein